MRNAPGEPLLIEAVKTMQVLADDFITFQEIYLRYYSRNIADLRRDSTDEIVKRELDLTCFSPTKVTFEPSIRDKRMYVRIGCRYIIEN